MFKSCAYIEHLINPNIFCRCNLRFPSTNIRLYFQSLLDDTRLNEKYELPISSPSSSRQGNGNMTGNQFADMKPLNISIPQAGGFGGSIAGVGSSMKLGPHYHHSNNHSPPSPTGTIRY